MSRCSDDTVHVDNDPLKWDIFMILALYVLVIKALSDIITSK